ncbi:hypothetical protein GB937_005572 [Aspergillus fischeri]|nr:hypothetical protein GB937_005572 [Aspergillus fischeri]
MRAWNVYSVGLFGIVTLNKQVDNDNDLQRLTFKSTLKDTEENAAANLTITSGKPSELLQHIWFDSVV